jgi:cytochrome c-type biogenesis protein CcmH
MTTNRLRFYHVPFSHPRFRQLCWALLVGALLALIAAGGSALAQDGPAKTAADISADQVNEVARQLWCPLCSGVRLDSCELKACEQMKEMIAIKLAEGEDLESIRTYFVGQYGPQVLGEPPKEGFNWLAWILPVVVLMLGGFFFWRVTRGMVRRSANRATLPAAPTSSSAEDDYERKLEQELAKYG